MIIPVLREKFQVKLVPAIPIGAPKTLTNEIIQTPPLVALKTNKTLPMLSKAATYLIFYCIIFLNLFLG